MNDSGRIRRGPRAPRSVAVALCISAACAPALGCDADAAALFSCEAAGGRKYIELCVSSSLTGADSYLEYRFGSPARDGSPESVELVFPPARNGSLKRFVGA